MARRTRAVPALSGARVRDDDRGDPGRRAGLAGLVALPAALNFLGLSAYSKLLIQAISFAVLLVFVLLALSLLYRFGPSRRSRALALDHAGVGAGDAAVAAGLGGVLALRRRSRQLRRDLWLARRRDRGDDVVLCQRLCRAAGGGAERGAGAADRARQHYRAPRSRLENGGRSWPITWRSDRRRREHQRRVRNRPLRRLRHLDGRPSGASGPTRESVTVAIPPTPSARAAARERSMIRLPLRGSRSLIVTTIERPSSRETRTRVPSGSDRIGGGHRPGIVSARRSRCAGRRNSGCRRSRSPACCHSFRLGPAAWAETAANRPPVNAAQHAVLASNGIPSPEIYWAARESDGADWTRPRREMQPQRSSRA